MKILEWLDEKFEETVLIYSLIFTVVLVFMQVVMRYFFKNSLSWSEELARYIFLYQIWVGASYAVKKKSHLRIQIIKEKFTGRNKILLEVFVLVLWLIFSVFLFLRSASLTSMIWTRGQVSPAMRIPMAYAYASVPIGTGLMSFRLIQQLYYCANELKSFKGGEAL